MHDTKSAWTPLDPAFRRLHDAHRQWHLAEIGYFEPEEFRLALHSCIQTMRSVTFVLQSNKRNLTNFEEWYAPQQENMRRDIILRWLVEARNHIEKQGDLETFSQIRADIIASYFDNLRITTVEGRLFDDMKELFQKVPPCYLVGQIFENGALRIRRRWVANSLPDYELLDALAYAYGKLSLLLTAAAEHWSIVPTALPLIHELDPSDPMPKKARPTCMNLREGMLEGIFSLKDWRNIKAETKKIVIDESEKSRARQRFEKLDRPAKPPGTLSEMAEYIFRAARIQMEADGYHIHIAFLQRGNRLVKMVELSYENRNDKYLLMRELAEIVRDSGADSVIYVGEAWTALSGDIPHMKFAADVPTRQEILLLAACSRTESFRLSAPLTRNGEQVAVGMPSRTQSEETPFFAPIRKIWAEIDAL